MISHRNLSINFYIIYFYPVLFPRGFKKVIRVGDLIVVDSVTNQPLIDKEEFELQLILSDTETSPRTLALP